ncbi:MAG TPA: hypothetical protein VIU13_05910 [Chryseolinea sp.]
MGNVFIKKYRSSIKYLPIILLLLLACDGEENVEPNEPDPSEDWTSCLLARIDRVEESVLFKYNADGRLIKNVFRPLNRDSIVSTIEYYNDHIVRISQPLGYIEYEYDADNNIIAGTIFAKSKVEETFYKVRDFVYTYNEKSQMDSTIMVGLGYRRYEYSEQGYLINTYYKEGSSPEKPASQILEYDDQKAPESSFFVYYNVLGSDIYVMALNLPRSGPHNIKSTKVWLGDGTTETRQYSFTYNNLGYPTSVSGTGGLLGTTKSTLSYSCK